MDKTPLERIVARCRMGIHIEINTHRTYHMTATARLEELEGSLHEGDSLDIPPEVRRRMEETNTIVQIQAYPNNSVGSYQVMHCDLDVALARMADLVEEEPDL